MAALVTAMIQGHCSLQKAAELTDHHYERANSFLQFFGFDSERRGFVGVQLLWHRNEAEKKRNLKKNRKSPLKLGGHDVIRFEAKREDFENEDVPR